MTEWRIIMTSKQRTELKSQAMKLDSIFQIGKSSLTPVYRSYKSGIKGKRTYKDKCIKEL